LAPGKTNVALLQETGMTPSVDRQRILVVDDEPAIRRVILRQLHALEGVELFEAESGEKALELVESLLPHLILLDIKMPGINGYQVCAQVRANPANRFAKVILLSSLNQLQERLQGYQVGADLYLTKPFEEEELVALVKVFLRLRHAEEVDQLKTSLLQLVAHESRTPLNSILGYSDLLRLGLFDPSDLREIGTEIHLQGKLMLRQIEKADLFCRLISDSYRLKAAWEGVGSVLQGLFQQSRFPAERFDLEINTNLELEADWELLTQVFGFLLENALQHSPPEAKVLVKAEMVADRIIIKVSDQGKGILPHNRQAILEPLYVEDILHHDSGQGLSLALSKRIVELHGGNLWVEDNQPQGAVFVLSLPKPLAPKRG